MSNPGNEKAKGPFRMVIVRDGEAPGHLWLNGFNASCLRTMYAEKPMQGHDTMQAIAGANRMLTPSLPPQTSSPNSPSLANGELVNSLPDIWKREEIIAHTECLARSIRHWTGRELMPVISDPRELSRRVFEAPFVLVSHGIEANPILNYGNRSALALWDIAWDELTRMPSRLTAEAPNREDRARLLERVSSHGFIDNYSGVRISRTGRRFRIAQATVWNLLLPDGGACGQAAMFSEWTFLD